MIIFYHICNHKVQFFREIFSAPLQLSCRLHKINASIEVSQLPFHFPEATINRTENKEEQEQL
jgi:hypothetical protein